MKRVINKGRCIIVGAGIVVAFALAGFLWIVLGPGPMDFASGRRVPIAYIHGSDPTGVPAELARPPSWSAASI